MHQIGQKQQCDILRYNPVILPVWFWCAIPFRAKVAGVIRVNGLGSWNRWPVIVDDSEATPVAAPAA